MGGQREKKAGPPPLQSNKELKTGGWKQEEEMSTSILHKVEQEDIVDNFYLPFQLYVWYNL